MDALLRELRLRGLVEAEPAEGADALLDGGPAARTGRFLGLTPAGRATLGLTREEAARR